MYCQSILDRITAGSREILGENLVGVYLHGSLAMGCFQPWTLWSWWQVSTKRPRKRASR